MKWEEENDGQTGHINKHWRNLHSWGLVLLGAPCWEFQMLKADAQSSANTKDSAHCSPLQQSYSMTYNKKTWLQIPQNIVVKFVWTSLQLIFLPPFKTSNVEPLQQWLNICLLSPYIFTIAYKFFKADNELVQIQINCIFPKLKRKKRRLFSRILYLSSCLLFVEYNICFNFAPRTTAVALYLSNLKK